MFQALAAGALMASLLTGAGSATLPTDDPNAAPPGSKITIDVVTVNGSGCPAGTAAVAPAPDNTAFTVTYSEYLAQVGVGAKATDNRKNCQININIHVPGGFTYAIAQADYRGYAQLVSGATGLQRANYYFQGMSATAYVNHNFSGPLSDDWQTTDRTDVAALVWAPCGEVRNLNINTELRVAAGTSDPATTTSYMTMDSTDGSLQSIYHLAWKEC